MKEKQTYPSKILLKVFLRGVFLKDWYATHDCPASQFLLLQQMWWCGAI